MTRTGVLKWVILIAFSCFCFSTFASAPSKLNCKAYNKTKTVQCIYRVVGQVINKPNKTSKLYAITNMSYALCSNSLCTLKHENSKVASCLCSVYGVQGKKITWKNASVGPKNIRRSYPVVINRQLVKVTSNFSEANIKNFHAKKITCKFRKPMPWANCFGIQCQVVKATVRGKLKTMAICRCPLVLTKIFFSIGPRSTRGCKLSRRQVWSAATYLQGQNAIYIMKRIYNKYYPNSLPTK